VHTRRSLFWTLLLVAPLLGVADSGRGPEAAQATADALQPPTRLLLAGVLSEEAVVWVEDFGWMGRSDLFEALGVEVEAPSFAEAPGSQESLDVLAAVLSLLEEGDAGLAAAQGREALEVREEPRQREGRPGRGLAEASPAPEQEPSLSPEEARARFVTALEALAPRGSPWLRVRAQLAGVSEPLEAVEWEGDFPWALALVGVGEVQWHDERFVTPLHEAAAAGAFRAALLLLDAGAEVAALDARRWLPIHYAARHGHAALVSLLLAHGSPLDWRGPDQRSPLQLAAQHGHEQVIEVLLASASPVDDRTAAQLAPLHLAVLAGRAGAVRQLLEAGAKVSARAGRGVTPLHLAALQADPEILALLLEAGASPELENRDGRTPRDVAQRNGHETAFSAPADLE